MAERAFELEFQILVNPSDSPSAFGGDELKNVINVGGVDHHDGARPIRDVGRSRACIHPIGAAPVRSVAVHDLGCVVVDDARALVFDENRVQSGAEKGSGGLGVVHVGTQVGEKRVNAQDVELVAGQPSGDVREELVAGEPAFRLVEEIAADLLDLCLSELQSFENAVTHLGEVFGVVLGLDGEDFQRARRTDAEGGQAKAPKDVLLHAGG